MPAEEEEERVCRICLGNEENESNNHLISPCLCRGSMRYVHISCLQSWRRTSTRSESILRCDQCHHTYNIHQTAFALFLLSEHGPIAVAVLSLVLAVHILGVFSYGLLFMSIGEGGKGVAEVMRPLFHWLRLGPRFRFSHIREFGMGRRPGTSPLSFDSFITETAYGHVLVLGTAFIALVAFCHYTYTRVSRHYIQHQRGEGHAPIVFQFDPLVQGGMGMFLFWIYQEIVEAKSGRGMAVMGLVSAWYYVYGHAVLSAKGLAQWLGETILEPTQLQ